jgi:phage tail-like protein
MAEPMTAPPTDLILTGPADFDTRTARLAVDAASGALVIARDDRLRLPATDAAAAAVLLAGQRPMLCDIDRNLAWIDAAGTALLTGPVPPAGPDDDLGEPVRANDPDGMGASAEDLELASVQSPLGTAFTALAMQGRRIALVWSNGTDRHGLSVVELGSKTHVQLALDAEPRRVWVDARARVWVVTADARLLRCDGGPLPQDWRPDPTAFRPLADNPLPLGVRQVIALPAGLDARAICADADHLYLLGARAGGERVAALELAPPFDRWRIFALDADLPAVTDCRAVPIATESEAEDELGRLALWVPAAADAPADRLDCPLVALDRASGRAVLLRERYPRRAPVHNAFLANPDAAPLYLSAHGVLALTALPQARFYDFGTGILAAVPDSLAIDTLWDRLRLTACIPEGTRVVIQLRAYDHATRRVAADWHDQGQPVPVRGPEAADLPPVAAAAGARLWDLVIRKQPDTGAVRELRGRWLEVKVTLAGNGLATPRMFALAVRQPRRSHQRALLPEFMHQGEAPTEGTTGLANGADVRERLFAALDGVLDPLARRIDGAEVLIDPRTTPAALLPPLEFMLGERPPAHWPQPRRRAWLALAGELQRWRGTYKGLCLALDIATDGAVGRGRIVPVEDFRLRRPLFTALGIDFAAIRHPLTLGTVASGNSIVGDTLTLGPDDARTLLLALVPGAEPSATTIELMQRYADGHAHRLSVVVHASAAALRGLIDEVLADELPAHLSAKIIETDRSFVPGLAPLLGIHSFLEAFPAWRRMVLDRERIGGAAVLINRPVLRPGRSVRPAAISASDGATPGDTP